MSDDLLRVYLDPSEIGNDGYPYAWHRAVTTPTGFEVIKANLVRTTGGDVIVPAIKDHVRSLAGDRCVRCGHPFVVGKTPGEWSPCDERCIHEGPMRWMTNEGWEALTRGTPHQRFTTEGYIGAPIEAQWRVLTVHHLNGVKYDCRWWNLVALCQRCHLTIQSKVYLERPWNREHSEWFKPYAAGWYAWRYLDEEPSREETMERLDEFLALEKTQESLF